ncbi:MAG TPA: hypothetical protein VGC79_19660, partial [Polyangiaceae bacterium]
MSAVRRLIAFCLVAALPIGLAQAAEPAPEPRAPASASAAQPSAAAAPAAANNGHEAPQAQANTATGAPAAAPPAGHPGMGNNDPQADLNEASPSLEPGTISATIVNDQGMPLVGQRVRLGIMFQKIAEGESRSEKFAQADAQGNVQFTGLTRGSDYAYRVTVQV